MDRKTLIAMLAKSLAACTRLSTTVSRLFEPQLQKNRHFYVPFIFCLPWGNHAKGCMNDKTIQCLPNPSQLVPIYLQQFPPAVIRTASAKKSPFSRTAAQIFVSPGDAPAIITQYVA